MSEFPNPYKTDGTGARPIPGVVSQQLASFVEIWFKMVGVSLYTHEHEGLAHVIGAVLRAYPKIGDFAKSGDSPK
jgi:hypothetical protein